MTEDGGVWGSYVGLLEELKALVVTRTEERDKALDRLDLLEEELMSLREVTE